MKRIVISCLLTAFVVASPARAEITKQMRECYDWIATLGFPDVKDAQWAEIWIGGYWNAANETSAQTRRAFIIEDHGEKFRVLGADLTDNAYTKGKPEQKDYERVRFEPRSFIQDTKTVLDGLRKPADDHWSRFGAVLDQKSEVIFLSYATWRKGDDSLARELFQEAAKLRNVPGPDGREVKRSMRDDLEMGLGHAAMWDAVLRFGGGNLGGDRWGMGGDLEPRPKLLERFRKIVKFYPISPHHDRAEKTVAMLEKMIAEDEKHTKLTTEDIAKLQGDRQVDEWIFLLRDQHGYQMSQPGSCDIFGFSDKGESPAHHLEKIGYAAVPKLIESLGDERFSRSVGFHRDFHFSHTVLTVGDCAQQVLNRIAGRSFYAPRTTSSYMSRDEEVEATKKLAREWWEQFQKKGERQMLIDQVVSGEESPDQFIAKLREKFPADVDAAVMAGAQKATDPWTAQRYISHLGGIKSDTAKKLLLARMKDDGNFEVKMSAARELLHQGHPAALLTIVMEWNQLAPADHDGLSDGFGTLVDLLVSSGSETSIRELVKNWDQRVPYERFEIVEKLGENKPATKEAKGIVMELLARATEDTSARTGMSGNRGDFHFSSPRICDFATWALHELEPDAYAFSPKAARHQRDRERVSAANVWRGRHGKELLPMPEKNLPKLPREQALQITRVTTLPATMKAGRVFSEFISGFKGKDFNENTLPGILHWFAGTGITGVSGLDVEALRDEDLTGVEIIVHLTPGPYPATGDWKMNHSGNIGKNHLGSASGSCSLSAVLEDGFWNDFSREVKKALDVPPEAEISLRAVLSAAK